LTLRCGIPKTARGSQAEGRDLVSGPETDRQRLRALNRRLKAAKGAVNPAPRGDGHVTQAQAGWRMVTELVAGIGIGFAMGWGLDSVTGMAPVFIVVMTMLGFAAGVKVMLRTAAEITAQHKRAQARTEDGPNRGEG
jgi:ATP synthase protein I